MKLSSSVAVVERSAAHIRERRDFDISALNVLLVSLSAEHVKQRVVERTEIRVDLALQITRQKSELLTRLNSGTREDNAVDLLASESCDSHCDREVGLARTRGAYADGDRVLGDHAAVALLADGFRLYRLALRCDADAVARELLDLLLAALADKRDAVADILLR